MKVKIPLVVRTRGIIFTFVKYAWYYSLILRERWYFLYELVEIEYE